MVVSTKDGKATASSGQLGPSAEQIRDWLVSYLADLLALNPGDVDVTLSFDGFGLDSSAAIGLTGDLGEWLCTEVDATMAYDYPSIEALAEQLAQPSPR